jgi:hypothetical protein
MISPEIAYKRHRLFKGSNAILTGLDVPLFFVALHFMPFAAVLAVVIPVLLSFHIILSIANHRALKALYATNFRICPACNYDLQRSPSLGRCPECGRPYSTGSLLRIWRDRIESP